MFDNLFGDDTANEGDEIEQLRELLARREATLQLEAVYGRPYPNMTDEPTVVFPYTLYTSDGAEYGGGAKEFVVPEDGLLDAESPLVEFVAKRHGIAVDDVDFQCLVEVEGTSAGAELTDDGDVVVGVTA